MGDDERGENRDGKLRSGLKQDSGAGARQHDGGLNGDDEGASWGDEVAKWGVVGTVRSDGESRPESESKVGK